MELGQPLLTPPGVMHYQAGPVTYRQGRFFDRDWILIFVAKHDGTGWLVVESYSRALVFMPGDYVHVRARVVEDHGRSLVLRFEDEHEPTERMIPRSTLRFIEERGPIPS